MHPALDLVRVGQPRKEVRRVAHPCHARARLVPLEHPGAGADAGLGLLQITVCSTTSLAMMHIDSVASASRNHA